jgi:hypothetical protein
MAARCKSLLLVMVKVCPLFVNSFTLTHSEGGSTCDATVAGALLECPGRGSDGFVLPAAFATLPPFLVMAFAESFLDLAFGGLFVDFALEDLLVLCLGI